MVPVTVVVLMPRRCAHPEAIVDGTFMASVAEARERDARTLLVTVVGLRVRFLRPRSGSTI